MATKPTNKKKNSPLKNIFVFPMSSRRQFRRLMMGMSLLFVVILGYHLYFVRQIQSGTLFPLPDAIPVDTGETLNAKKLTSVLDRYDTKATVRAAAITMTPAVSDPSK